MNEYDYLPEFIIFTRVIRLLQEAKIEALKIGYKRMQVCYSQTLTRT